MGLVEMKGGSYTAAIDGNRVIDTPTSKIRERKSSYSIIMLDPKGNKVMGVPPVVQDLATILVLRDEKAQLKPNRPSLSPWVSGVISTASVASAGFLVASVFSFVLELNLGDARMVLPSFTAMIAFGLLTLSTFRLNRSVKELTTGKLK